VDKSSQYTAKSMDSIRGVTKGSQGGHNSLSAESLWGRP